MHIEKKKEKKFQSTSFVGLIHANIVSQTLTRIGLFKMI